MEHLLLVGSAVVGPRTATQLFAVIWSLRADASGQRHAGGSSSRSGVASSSVAGVTVTPMPARRGVAPTEVDLPDAVADDDGPRSDEGLRDGREDINDVADPDTGFVSGDEGPKW